jgi:arylsulfatase
MALEDELWIPDMGSDFYMTDAISNYAMDRILQHNERYSNDPFFLYVAYTAPHWPLHALEEDIIRYKDRFDAGWDVIREERYDRMRKLGIIDESYRLSPRPDVIPAWEDAPNKEKMQWPRRMEVYNAMIDRMDMGIGRIVEALKQSGEFENTLILFLSDNGASPGTLDGNRLDKDYAPIGARGSYVGYGDPWANVSNTPFRWWKVWAHEGGIATPLIVHWPYGIKSPGRIDSSVGHVIDIMATCVDVAGAKYPTTFHGKPIIPLEGKSLAPIFDGEQRENHEALYWEFAGFKAIRKDHWKLVYGKKIGKWELYDIEADPTELYDLVEQHPELTNELKKQWNQWAERKGVFVEFELPKRWKVQNE